MLDLNWIPIKVFPAKSMLVSIKKSCGIIKIKQKFDTMAAFVGSENFQNQTIFIQPENKYHCAEICHGAKLNLHNGSKFWRKKLIWFENIY